MNYTSIHKIVTGYLLKRRYSIHFYIDFLKYCADGLRELQFDTVGNVQISKLPINSYGAIEMPCGYMDWVRIGVPNGQYITPLAQRQGMSRLNSFNSNGDKQPYGDDYTDSSGSHGVNANTYGMGFGVHFNSMLETTGRYYGNRGNGDNTFVECRKRNEIQININLGATEIILEWISDGTASDNATQVHPYSINTLEEYMELHRRINNRSSSDSQIAYQQRRFDHAHNMLRARLNPLTKADVLYIFNKNKHGSIK